MANRETLHRLVEDLPESLVEEAQRRLIQLRDDPVLRAFLEATEDDEPLSDEDVAAIEEARAEIAHGEVSDWEDVKRRVFGNS